MPTAHISITLQLLQQEKTFCAKLLLPVPSFPAQTSVYLFYIYTCLLYMHWLHCLADNSLTINIDNQLTINITQYWLFVLRKKCFLISYFVRLFASFMSFPLVRPSSACLPGFVQPSALIQQPNPYSLWTCLLYLPPFESLLRVTSFSRLQHTNTRS